MTATGLLKKDHGAARRLLTQLGRTSARAKKTRQHLIEKLVQEIEIHARLEEEIFYPLLREVPAAAERLPEAKREHDAVRQRLDELRTAAPGSPDLRARVQALRRDLLHHVREEEGALFPMAEPLGRERLERVGAEMEGRKQELQRGSGAREDRMGRLVQDGRVDGRAADERADERVDRGDEQPDLVQRVKRGLQRLRGAA